MYFMKMYEGVLMHYRIKDQEHKRKAAERKSQQAGKTYTHNVQG